MKLVIVGLVFVVSLSILSACETIPAAPISETDCQVLANQWKGESLTNMFGMETKTLKISKPVEVSRGEKRLVCRGEGMTSSGPQDFRMTFSEDSDGDRWHNIEAID